ncbi:Extracellular metalloprotease like protein [Verticillium longisporum]|nr:Extracellular metalloprotease like protein [Verticillium longisporum]
MRQFIKLAFSLLLLLLGLLVSAQEDSAAISSAGGASSVEPSPSDVPVDLTSPVVTPTPSEEPVVPVPGTEAPSDQSPVDVPSSVAGEVSISAQSSPLVSSSDIVEASATSADESSATDASASATPTEGEDDGEAEEYDFEAREVTPLESRPDVVTEDELLAEAEANLPVMEIPEEDAREIAALEASMFEHFVRNDPVINPEDNITLPESVSNCELGLGKRDMAGGWSGQSNSRVMRRQECRPVTRLDCDLHVWHMLSARGAKRPDTIETRIEESVAYLKSVFEPRGIYFNHVSTNFRQPVSTTADWKTIKKSESKLVKWQTASRAGDHMALNLWLVNNLVPASGVEKAGGNLMGYATFPEMQRWATDGIVMQQSAMGTPASTFVHEVGHWLGLRHTFGNRVDDGETDCLVGDGLRRTTHTRGDRSVIFECEQLPCNEERGVMRIPNFMSYSKCKGQPINAGFHVDQKAAMFARTIRYRRDNAPDDCRYIDPRGLTMYSERSVHKRSSMQDLVDGKCPDLDAEADRIQNEPAAAPSGDAAGGDTQGGSGGDTQGGSGNGNDNNGSGASDLVIHLGTWCLVGLTGFMVALM